MREHDAGAHDGGAGFVLGAGLDQRLVDLDGVEGEPLQVGERGIAGAEIVERELGAGPLEQFEHVRRGLGILHHEGLGDLEAQRSARRHGAAEQRGGSPGTRSALISCRLETLTLTNSG